MAGPTPKRQAYETARLAARLRRLEREAKTRYVIEFQYAPKLVNGRWTYPKAVWPILFHSRGAAELLMSKVKLFANNPPKGKPGHIRSAAIEPRFTA